MAFATSLICVALWLEVVWLALYSVGRAVAYLHPGAKHDPAHALLPLSLRETELESTCVSSCSWHTSIVQWCPDSWNDAACTASQRFGAKVRVTGSSDHLLMLPVAWQSKSSGHQHNRAITFSFKVLTECTEIGGEVMSAFPNIAKCYIFSTLLFHRICHRESDHCPDRRQ